MHTLLIHIIVNMQANYPTTRIIIRKDNFKSTYRRQHLSEQAAIQSATQIEWKGELYFLISLRITFWGENGPDKWSTISKPIADLGNALLLDDTWEPRETQAPNQYSIPPPSTQDESTPFFQSKPLAVYIPVDPQGKIDMYLYYCITVIPDIGSKRSRGNAEIPLAIHALSRPLAQIEIVPRDEIIYPS